jgi:hypothetical protein
MQKGLIRKGLVFSVIVLFMGVSVLSSVSSKEISESNNRMNEENKDIKPANGFTEVFSFVEGVTIPYNWGGGIFWNSFDFYSGPWSTTLTVREFTIFPFSWGDTYTKSSGYIPFFVGIMRWIGGEQHEISGIVIGNIT